MSLPCVMDLGCLSRHAFSVGDISCRDEARGWEHDKCLQSGIRSFECLMPYELIPFQFSDRGASDLRSSKVMGG